MRKALYIGMPVAMFAIASFLVPNAWATFAGTEGCTPGYFKNNSDTNPRVAALDHVNLRAAIMEITSREGDPALDLGPAADMAISDAVQLKGGGLNAALRHAGAAVYNNYYDPAKIDYLTIQDIRTAIQLIIDGVAAGDNDLIEDGKDILADGNELGCSVDAFGREI